MAHHLQTLLQQWALSADEPWVLALITSVQGSSYRKPGAMMLFHPWARAWDPQRRLFGGRSAPSGTQGPDGTKGGGSLL